MSREINGTTVEAREKRSQEALQALGLEVADRWATGFQNRPTQQLVLQKIIDPAVKHILSTVAPWIIGMGLLFLLMIVSTVITCVIVLRSNPHAVYYYTAAATGAASDAAATLIGASV
jgi:hypothetical protein